MSRRIVLLVGALILTALALAGPAASQSFAACPCSLWGPATVPANAAQTTDGNPVELGVKFRVEVSGTITALRFYKGLTNTGTHVGHLWSASGTRLASVTFTGESASGWQEASLSSPVAVSAGTTYVASYHAPNGNYAFDSNFFATAFVNGPLRATSWSEGGGNGVYAYGASAFPASTYNATNYWVDVVFGDAGEPPDTTAPVISSVAATATAGGVATVSWATDEASSSRVDYGGDPASLSRDVADATRVRAHSVQIGDLTAGATYHYRVTSADAAGNSATSPAAPAAPHSFTVPWSGGACPCSLWGPATVPANAAQTTDGNPVELGVKFRVEVSGTITALRFYKGSTNTGTHVGHLWSASGTRLASVTFTGETGFGVAGGEPVVAGRGVGGHYLRRLVSRAQRQLRVRLELLRDGVRQRPIACDFVERGRRQRGLRVRCERVPGEHLQRDELLGRRHLQRCPRAAGHDGADRDIGLSQRRVDRRQRRRGADGHVQRGDKRRDDHHVDGAAQRTGRRGPGKRQLRRGRVARRSSRRLGALGSSTTYTMTVNGGASGVADTAGNRLAADRTWTFTTAAFPPPPDSGPGGPILVITKSSNPFSQYYAEILRAEGLNEFALADISTVSAATLADLRRRDPRRDDADRRRRSRRSATGSAAAATSSRCGPIRSSRRCWASAAAATTLANAYLKVDTSRAPGAGIVGETIQYHGTADRWSLSGRHERRRRCTPSASTDTTSPAVTLRNVGTNGGQAAAFTFDLARSIVHTRQGNPAWAGQERDGNAPIRSNDMFFGAAAGDASPTGSTSRRWRSRRRTSSSGCWRT